MLIMVALVGVLLLVVIALGLAWNMVADRRGRRR